MCCPSVGWCIKDPLLPIRKNRLYSCPLPYFQHQITITYNAEVFLWGRGVCFFGFLLLLFVGFFWCVLSASLHKLFPFFLEH